MQSTVVAYFRSSIAHLGSDLDAAYSRPTPFCVCDASPWHMGQYLKVQPAPTRTLTVVYSLLLSGPQII